MPRGHVGFQQGAVQRQADIVVQRILADHRIELKHVQLIVVLHRDFHVVLEHERQDSVFIQGQRRSGTIAELGNKGMHIHGAAP